MKWNEEKTKGKRKPKGVPFKGKTYLDYIKESQYPEYLKKYAITTFRRETQTYDIS